MTNVIPFEYEKQDVRVIRDENGEPWFVAKDVCDILEYVNSRDAIRTLDDDERNTVDISDGIDSQNGQPGNPNVNVISESGLYTLIIRSNKEAAKPFRRWVTHDVLPALRKTGRYVIPGTGHPAVDSARCRPLSDEAMERLKSGADELVWVARAFASSLRVYRKMGAMNRRQAVLAANTLTLARTGVDCIKLTNIRRYVPNWDFAELADQGGRVMVQDLMECLIWVDGQDNGDGDTCLAVNEMVSDSGRYVRFKRLLEGYGVKKTERGIFFHPASVEERLLVDARHNWNGTPVRDTLLQVPGARSAQLRLSGVPVRGVIVPYIALRMEGGAS